MTGTQHFPDFLFSVKKQKSHLAAVEQVQLILAHMSFVEFVWTLLEMAGRFIDGVGHRHRTHPARNRSLLTSSVLAVASCVVTFCRFFRTKISFYNRRTRTRVVAWVFCASGGRNLVTWKPAVH